MQRSIISVLRTFCIIIFFSYLTMSFLFYDLLRPGLTIRAPRALGVLSGFVSKRFTNKALLQHNLNFLIQKIRRIILHEVAYRRAAIKDGEKTFATSVSLWQKRQFAKHIYPPILRLRLITCRTRTTEETGDRGLKSVSRWHLARPRDHYSRTSPISVLACHPELHPPFPAFIVRGRLSS